MASFIKAVEPTANLGLSRSMSQTLFGNARFTKENVTAGTLLTDAKISIIRCEFWIENLKRLVEEAEAMNPSAVVDEKQLAFYQTQYDYLREAYSK